MMRLGPILVALALACVGPAADARLMVNQLVGFGKKMAPTCGAATPVYDLTGGTLTNLNTFHTYSIRTVVGSISTGGTQVRAQFFASTGAGETMVLKHASVGVRSGSTADTTATPTELTFNDGSSGVTIGTGSNAWSDWVDFTSTAAQDLIVVHDISDTLNQGAVRRSSAITPGRYSKESAESWNQATVTGFSGLVADVSEGMLKVEVRTCS